ncbi:MAG: acyl-CoA dehydrogenase family protein [Alphaproteobacteria bacterium]
MSDIRDMLVETAEKLFSDHSTPEVINASEQGVWAGDLWTALEEAGLTLAAVPEELGGAGGMLGDAFAVVRVAGRYAAPVPVAETVLAGWALAGSGLKVPAGPLAIAPVAAGDAVEISRSGDSWTVEGTARHVPWARHAGHVVVVGEGAVAAVPLAKCGIEEGTNLAGEPNDQVTFASVSVGADAAGAAGDGIGRETLWVMGALSRAVLMAGALERAFEHTARYTSERVQFGRALSKFQAVQQEIALMAGEVAAADVAADAAVAAAEAGDPTYQVAAAKVRVGQAANKIAGSSHQLHGAMGFTHEYPLQHNTRRLWCWRDEFGAEEEWAERLGTWLAEAGGDEVWPFISGSRAGLAA